METLCLVLHLLEGVGVLLDEERMKRSCDFSWECMVSLEEIGFRKKERGRVEKGEMMQVDRRTEVAKYGVEIFMMNFMRLPRSIVKSTKIAPLSLD